MNIFNTIRTSILLSTAVLAGCTNIHKLAPVGSIRTLSIDAKQRLVTVNENGGKDGNQKVVCAEPSPDALSATAASLASQGSVPNGASAKLAAAISNSAASIGLRSQPIQIMRDGYFRLCEAYMNGAIDKVQYNRVINGVGSVLAVVTAIDALGVRPVAPAVKVEAGGTNTQADPNVVSASTAGAGIIIENINPADNTLTPAQSNAIASVVHEYIEYQKFLLLHLKKHR